MRLGFPFWSHTVSSSGYDGAPCRICGAETAGWPCQWLRCVGANFPPSLAFHFRDCWKVPDLHLLRWLGLLNLSPSALVMFKSPFLSSYRKGVAFKGQIADSDDTDIMIFVWSRQAAASAFSGSSRACNLIFLGKPPLCGLGLVGGPAELCNGILSSCSILECDEILTCPPDYILLHTLEDFLKTELCLSYYSLVTLNFQLVSVRSEGAANVFS